MLNNQRVYIIHPMSQLHQKKSPSPETPHRSENGQGALQLVQLVPHFGITKLVYNMLLLQYAPITRVEMSCLKFMDFCRVLYSTPMLKQLSL